MGGNTVMRTSWPVLRRVCLLCLAFLVLWWSHRCFWNYIFYFEGQKEIVQLPIHTSTYPTCPSCFTCPTYLSVSGLSHTAHSSLCKESSAELMLLIFGMGRDCLWDSDVQDWEWTTQLICSSFLYGTRLPLGQWGAKQIIYIPFHSLCCSLLFQRQTHPIQKQGPDQLCSPFSVLLLAVPEAVSSHTKVRRISSTRS